MISLHLFHQKKLENPDNYSRGGGKRCFATKVIVKEPLIRRVRKGGETRRGKGGKDLAVLSL